MDKIIINIYYTKKMKSNSLSFQTLYKINWSIFF
jgi:hypothetical protein